MARLNHGKPITHKTLEEKLKRVCRVNRWPCFHSTASKSKRRALIIIQVTKGYQLGAWNPGWGSESRITETMKGRELYLFLEGLEMRKQITDYLK